MRSALQGKSSTKQDGPGSLLLTEGLEILNGHKLVCSG